MVTPSFSSHASNFEKLGVTIRQINIIIIIIIKLKTISCYLLIIAIIIVVVHRRLIHAISFLVAQYKPEINAVKNWPWLNLILFPSPGKFFIGDIFQTTTLVVSEWSMTTRKYKVYQP